MPTKAGLGVVLNCIRYSKNNYGAGHPYFTVLSVLFAAASP